jgi:hypothetical protein
LQVTRAAMIKHFSGNLEHAFLWPPDRPGKV